MPRLPLPCDPENPGWEAFPAALAAWLRACLALTGLPLLWRLFRGR